MLLTMALCGLWHGASWTFVLWGTLHGCALVVCHAVAPLRSADAEPARLGADGRVRALTGVIFRAGSLEACGACTRACSACRISTASSRATPIIVAALCAFFLPASQDIVALA